jgi:hypothetical protein
MNFLLPSVYGKEVCTREMSVGEIGRANLPGREDLRGRPPDRPEREFWVNWNQNIQCCEKRSPLRESGEELTRKLCPATASQAAVLPLSRSSTKTQIFISERDFS